MQYAYPLSRGGIVVHAKSTKDKDTLLKNWPVGAFDTNSDQVVVHTQSQSPRCVLKDVSPYVSEDNLTNTILTQTGLKVRCRRLRYRDTNKPLPVVVATLESNRALQVLFTADLVVSGKRITIQAYRTKRNIPTRCYNCQGFGHIARLCTKAASCENCGESHTSIGGCCNKVKKCSNCQGSHSAADSQCPAFLLLRDRLSKRS